MNYVALFDTKEGYHEVNDIDVDKVYYINLNRAVDRNQHVLNQCQKHGLPTSKVQRFEAIDGSSYVFTPQERAMFRDCDYAHQPFAPKIMGNQLSHYRILQDMIQHQYKHILVLQDDAILRDGFVSVLNHTVRHLPPNAEMVNLGLHAFASDDQFQPWDLTRDDDAHHLSNQPVNAYVCTWHTHLNPCSLAYLVTLAGAKAMVAYFDKNGFHKATDWNFNHYLQQKHIFYGSTRVLATGNHHFKSSIFTTALF